MDDSAESIPWIFSKIVTNRYSAIPQNKNGHLRRPFINGSLKKKVTNEKKEFTIIYGDQANKRLIRFIKRPEYVDTYVLKYIVILKFSVEPFRSQQEIELFLKRNFGFSIIGGYWSRLHFLAVCFSGFSAMLDL